MYSVFYFDFLIIISYLQLLQVVSDMLFLSLLYV